RISAVSGFELPTVQIVSADESAELKKIADEAGKLPSRAGAPILRLRLVRLDDQNHALVLVAHHLVCDGGSIRLLVRELTALYGAYAEGRDALLPDLRLQYRDFVTYEQSLVLRPAFKEQLDYWQRQLADLPVL